MTKSKDHTIKISVENDQTKTHTGYLEGQILIAMPGMNDTRFAHSLVFLCSHDKTGAMGLVINKPYPALSLLEVLDQLDLLTDDLKTALPEKVVHYGGPVDPGRGFVLHSPDYFHEELTEVLNEQLSLTASVEIIDAIAQSQPAPKKSIITLGFASWSKSQLETELLDNSWLHCPATDTLLFDEDIEAKYELALKSIGISKEFLMTQAGHG